MDDHVGGGIINWLLGALAAIVGIIWRRQDTRIDRIETKVDECQHVAASLVDGHANEDYAKHGEITAMVAQEVATLRADLNDTRREIGDTRREIKADINTVIGLLTTTNGIKR